MTSTSDLAADLIDTLRTALGPDSVVDEASILDGYSHDTWPIATLWAKLNRHPHRPDLLVRASSTDDVVSLLRLANDAGVAVTPWGLGSSVTGQPLATRGGITLDLSGIVGVPDLNETDRTVTVPSGVRGGDLEKWLNERGYTLNHFPQSLHRSTVGGWIATRATGQFSSRYGGIEDLVTAYTVVLPDGSIVEVGQRPRAAMGPDFKHLFLGSEGTLGVVTKVTLKVFAHSEHTILEAFSMPSVGSGIEAMRRIFQAGLRPHLVRFYDADEARHALGDLDAVSPALFLGHQGLASVSRAEHGEATDIVMEFGGTSLGAEPVMAWLSQRYEFSMVENLLDRPGGYAETVEVANMWSRLEPMYTDLKQELAPLAGEVLGHFSHIYDQGSSLYIILLGSAPDDETALARLEEIWRRAMRVVLAHDGEVSHHHGCGLARQPWAQASLGSGHDLLRRIKAALDPNGVMNPGKLGL